MTPRGASKPLDVEHIGGDYGSWILASSQEDAEQWCGGKVEYAGLAYNVGWDRDRFQLRREFREETGMQDWWEVREDEAIDATTETSKVRPAWKELR